VGPFPPQPTIKPPQTVPRTTGIDRQKESRESVCNFVPRILFRTKNLPVETNIIIWTPIVSWQPGDLGVLRGVAECVAEEARTLGFASLTLVRFAFIGCNWILCTDREIASILGCT
jgi:hypothetical protein